MKLQIAGFCYVIFAVFIACTALVSSEKAVARHIDKGRVMVKTEQIVFNSERLDQPHTQTKTEYTITVWKASWCAPCNRYKRIEVPTLLKMGYKVTLKDIDWDNPPRNIRKIPTVLLYFKGQLLKSQINWSAKDLDKFVTGHMKESNLA